MHMLHNNCSIIHHAPGSLLACVSPETVKLRINIDLQQRRVNNVALP